MTKQTKHPIKDLNLTQLKVYVALRNNSKGFFSSEAIAWIVNKSPRTIQENLRKLEKLGLVQVDATVGGTNYWTTT